MFHSRSKQAATAFEALCALDTTAAERTELVAVGVAQHTIQALYPVSDFEAIVIRLIERLPQIDPKKITTRLARRLRALTIEWTIEAPGAGLASPPDGSAVESLRYGIEARIIGEPDLRVRYSNQLLRGTMALIIADACWFAWWGMANRDSLPLKMQKRANALMVTVGRIFSLSS